MERFLHKGFSYVAVTAAIGSVAQTQAQSTERAVRGNILVIVADDLGKETLSIYDIPTKEKAITPVIENLTNRGIRFDNVWGAPLSAPVRAAMLTGRYGHHTGIVALDITLPLEEQTLFEELGGDYAKGVIGKWHLSTETDFAPSYGIDHFAGFARGGGVRNYSSWQFTQNGVTTQSTEYITSQITNSAKEWISSQQTEQPWFCWVAYNTPHTPFHLPPKGTHTRKKLSGSEEDISKNPLQYYLAMVENMDYEIGRLIEGLDENTTIIFIGDNGTANNVLQSPYPTRHGKGSLYEGGVAIPMVVCGGGVDANLRGASNKERVSAVDIFPTVMELSGVEMPRYEDGYSFAGVLKGGESRRAYNFAEVQHQRMGYMNALSDGEYKIITQGGATTMAFALGADPYEEHNLLQQNLSAEQSERIKRLEEELKAMNISVKSLPKNKTSRAGAGGAGNQSSRAGSMQGRNMPRRQL